MKRQMMCVLVLSLTVGCGSYDVKDKRGDEPTFDGNNTSTNNDPSTNGGSNNGSTNGTAGGSNNDPTNNGPNNAPDNNDPSSNNANNTTPTDMPTLQVSPTSNLSLQEAGAPLELQLVLTAEPTDVVSIPVASTDDTEVVVTPERIEFTTGNWSTPQTVTLRAIDDLRPDGDDVTTVRFGPIESADELGGSEQSVEVTVLDGNCGNGVVDGDEACDADELTTACDYGEATCSVCNATCDLVPGTAGGFCGDGVLNGPEQCEGPTEECPYGAMSCVTCGASCQEVAGQVTGYCGDGVVNGPEACDGGTCCTTSCTPDPACGSKCLMISEYVEGQIYDKAIEIYNCDTVPINLERYELCMEYDGANGCSQWYDAQGTLQPGGTRVVCNDGASAALTPYCDVYERHATTFNGDDRLFLFYDEDNDGKWSVGDTVVDAFGELGNWPLGFPWEDRGWDRCEPTLYDGSGPWSVDDYFTLVSNCSVSNCSFGGLGVAPTFGCL